MVDVGCWRGNALFFWAGRSLFFAGMALFVLGLGVVLPYDLVFNKVFFSDALFVVCGVALAFFVWGAVLLSVFSTELYVGKWQKEVFKDG